MGKALIHNLKSNLCGNSLFAKLMRKSILVFVMVLVFFSCIIFYLLVQITSISNSKTTQTLLTSICDEYIRKRDNFAETVFPFYSKENYSVIRQIMNEPLENLINQNPFFLNSLTDVLEDVCLRERDVIAVSVYTEVNDKCYLYLPNENDFWEVDSSFPYYESLKKGKTGQMNVLPLQKWDINGLKYETYGLCGTIGYSFEKDESANIVILYDAQEIRRILTDYYAGANGIYYIIDQNGNTIFNSDSEFQEDANSFLETVQTGGQNFIYNGNKYTFNILYYENAEVYGIGLTPCIFLGSVNQTVLWLIIAILVMSILLFVFLITHASFKYGKRVNALISGIKKVEDQQLVYRIPLNHTDDEIEDISIKFNHMCDTIQDYINRIYVYEIKQKSAELKALQTGLNPHFLYNTLDAIRGKAEEDGNEDVAQLLVQMSNIMRYLVRSKRFVTLNDELLFCRFYLDMFQLRYEGAFDYSINCDSAMMEYGVPSGILQPLLENFFVHGIDNQRDDYHIDITGRIYGTKICFEIADNGKGISDEKLYELNQKLNGSVSFTSSYGLLNVNERIKIAYGYENCGLAVTKNEPTGTNIQIVMKAVTCEQLEKNMGSDAETGK